MPPVVKVNKITMTPSSAEIHNTLSSVLKSVSDSASVTVTSMASAAASQFNSVSSQHMSNHLSHIASQSGSSSQQQQYQWMYSLVDSSRVSTFLISMLLIVYGSFRSLNMEQEAKLKEKEGNECTHCESNKLHSSCSGHLMSSSSCNCHHNCNYNLANSNVQTLDTMQALCLPLGASVSLLIMFFFFDSMQMLFAVCTAIIAAIALAFLLLPMCQYIFRPCTEKKK